MLIPQLTLGVMRQKWWFLKHSNAIKTLLTDANNIARLQFENYLVNTWNQHFNTMYDYVNIYEKLFYMTKVNADFYLVPCETRPHRTWKSKHYITKVILCVLALGQDGTVMPIVILVSRLASGISFSKSLWKEAARIIQPVKWKKFITRVNKVIPVILPRSPIWSKHFSIQQDNTKPHTTDANNAIVQALQHDQMEFSNQPPNSPDFNH